MFRRRRSSTVPMCRTKKSTHAIEPRKTTTSPKAFSSSSSSMPAADRYSGNFSGGGGGEYSSNNFSKSSTASSVASSLKSLKSSLPENSVIYDVSEIASSTSNFLAARRLSSSSTSSSWRCSLRGKDAVVFKRRSRLTSPNLDGLRQSLSLISRSHHTSLVKLLGAALSGSHVYLAYEYVAGVNLAECLRNPNNPSFTILSTWLSRLRVATDLAHGLDYIHRCSGLSDAFVHNHIKTSSVIVTDNGPTLTAKICHFGTAELCGETRARSRKVEGTRGYMSPEFQTTGVVTQQCDVYAFGVVMLELVSGEEPLKYKEEVNGGGYRRVSVIETAREAVAVAGSRGGGVRRWVDRRLKDSFPVDVAEKTVQVALECVEEDPDKRPEMGQVAGLVSKLFLDSEKWAERIGLPMDISFSLAPR